jgi:hypothetical protein
MVEYFKPAREQLGIPYQTLSNNLYVRDCAEHERRLVLRWKPKKSPGWSIPSFRGLLARSCLPA